MINKCIDCKKEISKYAVRCKSCSRKGKLHHNYKTGKNKCIDCGKRLSDYATKRCQKCYYKLMNKKIAHCINCEKQLSKNIYIRCRKCQEIYKKTKIKHKKKHYCKKCGINISEGSKKGYCRKHNQLFRSHKDSCNCVICKSKRGEYVGKSNPFYNKIHSKSFKKEQSIRMGGTGVPYENSEYGAEFDNTLKEQVRFRDHYKCQICGCSQLENGRQLDVHHIDYNKLNNVLRNLIALCRKCHARTNYNREYWIQYFIDTKVLIIQRS